MKVCVLILLLAIGSLYGAVAQITLNHVGLAGPTYYFDTAGSDSNNCRTPAAACQTITHLNSLSLPAYANVLFKATQSFSGAIVLTTTVTPGPITISTYGSGTATISSTTSACLTATNIPGVVVNNLICTGSGNTVNGTPGISVINSQAGNTTLTGPNISGNTISGYGLIGIAVQGTNGQSGFAGTTISGNIVHDVTGNGASSTESLPCIKVNSTAVQGGTFVHSNVTITNNVAYNCTGTAANTTNHTGDGILVRETNGATISHNLVHDFGVNNGSTSSGPAGIWANDAENVTISFNEVYNGFSSQNIDGDGFDCDTGTINCTIEYNFAHDNQGAGILVFSGFASGVNNNMNTTLRYNIVQNNSSLFGADIYLAANAGTFSGLAIYNNTVYSGLGATLGSNPLVETGGVSPSGHVANNIFISTGPFSIISWADTASISFTGNDYYPASGAASFKITWGGTAYTTFAAWQTATNQEKIGGVNVGLTSNPQLYVPGGGFAGSGSGYDPSLLMAYNLQVGSPMIGTGLDLNTQFSINPGTQDFFGNAIAASGGSYPVGAAIGDFTTFTTSCTQSSTFLGRVASFTKAQKVNYNSLICGMVKDGDFALLDAFYMLGAPNSAAELLNLISTSYALTVHGTVTFTANRGAAGDGTTGYYDTGFIPSTASGNFSANSGLLGDYDLTANVTAGQLMSIGGHDSSATISYIVPYSNNCAPGGEGYVNENNAGATLCNNSASSAKGSHQATRTSSTAESLYFNGGHLATTSSASNGNLTVSIFVLAQNNMGTAGHFLTDTLMAAWIGGGSASAPRIALRTNSFATALGINAY